MTDSLKVNDMVSVVGTVVTTVICRGAVKEIITEGGRQLATLDGLYYFHPEGCLNYKVVPQIDTAVDDTFFLAYQHIPGITYQTLGSEEESDIYINLNEESVKELEDAMVEDWSKMFHESPLTVDVKNAEFRIECGENELKDVGDLVLDEHNIFSKLAHTFDGHTYVFSLGDLDNLLEKYEKMEKVYDYLETLVECNFRQCPEEDLLYLNNHGRRSFQWEVWAMCNNYCTYCYLGNENRHTDKERQMKSLNDLHKAIDNLDFRIYNNISLIGGDFFQGQLEDPEVHDSFMAMIEKCAKAYHDRKIGGMWITCTMTIGDQKDLYEMIEIFKKYECFPNPNYGSSGIWLCTSWDTKGRFHTPAKLANWEYHMQHIHEVYPWIKFNTTIILMGPFCQDVIDGKWDAREFVEKFHTTVFYKQVGMGKIGEVADYSDCANDIEKQRKAKKVVNEEIGFDFCPTRSQMLKTLRIYAEKWPEQYDRLFNIQYRADELHRNFNDSMNDFKTKRNKNSANETDVAIENMLNTCGHMLNYAPYSDSDKCCICDKKMIWQTIYGA